MLVLNSSDVGWFMKRMVSKKANSQIVGGFFFLESDKLQLSSCWSRRLCFCKLSKTLSVPTTSPSSHPETKLSSAISTKVRVHHLANNGTGEWTVDSAKIIHPDVVSRPDGVIHGIEHLLVPRSVQDDFNLRRSLQSITAVKPEGAPDVDPRTHLLKKPAPPVKPGSPPVLPIYNAMAPGPSLAPAPAPDPGGPHHHFNGEAHYLALYITHLVRL
ncbi:hypothetical protein K1719_022520 [Acacia pycnantha]|nr:hypothetical protein K1719_022520 [Acacia pycnantha]